MTLGTGHSWGQSSSGRSKGRPDRPPGRLDLHYFTCIKLDFAQETSLVNSELKLRLQFEIIFYAATLQTSCL